MSILMIITMNNTKILGCLTFLGYVVQRGGTRFSTEAVDVEVQQRTGRAWPMKERSMRPPASAKETENSPPASSVIESGAEVYITILVC